MSAFLVDENLPRSLAPSLRRAGFEVHDVRDLGLRGRPDTEVFALAVSRRLILISSDLGFGSLTRSSPESPGAILVRVPNEWPTSKVNELIEKTLSSLPWDTFTGSLVVIEPDRIRVRRTR